MFEPQRNDVSNGLNETAHWELLLTRCWGDQIKKYELTVACATCGEYNQGCGGEI